MRTAPLKRLLLESFPSHHIHGQRHGGQISCAFGFQLNWWQISHGKGGESISIISLELKRWQISHGIAQELGFVAHWWQAVCLGMNSRTVGTLNFIFSRKSGPNDRQRQRQVFNYGHFKTAGTKLGTRNNGLSHRWRLPSKWALELTALAMRHVRSINLHFERRVHAQCKWYFSWQNLPELATSKIWPGIRLDTTNIH